ncbi:hypothetical protein Y032_0233g3072 [Ancylostoma ceylanicum]|uniref:SCP domain-containing protein n=1 Tax=Ancylostoma ceylanicum TaxID=53326 RepID=A0A016SEZ8_9BILA|nr:hypothetical protein Y032_0233g3072 [Ancylostoma ceylanicum]
MTSTLLLAVQDYFCFFESAAGYELQDPNTYKRIFKELRITKLEYEGGKGTYNSIAAFLNASAQNWTTQLRKMEHKYKFGCQCSNKNGEYQLVCLFA